jgi:Putative transposase
LLPPALREKSTLILLALFSHTIYKEFNHFNHGISSGLDDPNRRQAPAGRILMAPSNRTILKLLFNAPSRAGAPLFTFLCPIARNADSQSQSSKTPPHLKTGFPFSQYGLDSSRFSSKSPFRKGRCRGIFDIRRTPFPEAKFVINRLILFLTFRHPGPRIKSRAGFDPPSSNRLHSAFRRNDGVLDNYELWHVLPAGFHKIRHYGFLANGRSKTKLARIREILEKRPESEEQRISDDMESVLCPICRIGRLVPAFLIDPLGQMIIRRLSLLKAALVLGT